MMGLSLAITAQGGAVAFDPATATGLLAWFDGREGKTGDPLTAWARKAGSGLTDLTSAAGPDDGTDHLSYEIAGTEHMDGGTVANFTSLHRDGMLFVGLAKLDAVTGLQTFFDNHSRNASSGRNGISLAQNGTNLTFNLSNGSGTFCGQVSIGPSFGGVDAFTAGNWAIVEVGWEPDFGLYIRINGGPPQVANLVGSPASGNPLYIMTFGATSSGIGAISNWMGGDQAQLLFADETILPNRSEIDAIVSAFAALQSVSLDTGGEFTGGVANTVLLDTTTILTGVPNDFFKRGMSNVDGSSPALQMSVTDNADYRDWSDRFRLFNGTSEDSTLTISGVSTTLRSVAQGVTGTPGIVCIGDSRTAPTSGDTYVKRLKDRFTTSITLLGTVGTGSWTHEGHSGWDYGDLFAGASSPITDGGGSLDIASWHTAMGAQPDIYVLWSDVNAFVTTIASESTGEAGWQALVDAEVGHIQDFITAVVAENADAIFIICTSPIYSKSAADYASYNAAFTAAGRLAVIDFIHRYWNPGLIAAFDEMGGSNIHLCDLHTAVDGTRAPTGDPFHFSTLAGYGHDAIEQRLAAKISEVA